MTAETLLSRLDGARSTGIGRWIAKCPAHEDRAPSLSIRELSDGRTLVHCFGGCGAAAVICAVGLEFADLFPPRVEQVYDRCKQRTVRPTFDALAAMHALAHEVLVIGFIASEFVPANDGLARRLQLAIGRIHNVLDAIGEPRDAAVAGRARSARAPE